MEKVLINNTEKESDTPERVYDRYKARNRVLTPDFIEGIPWDHVKDHPLSGRDARFLQYAAGVERATVEHYFAFLLRTPSIQYQSLFDFMVYWTGEEDTHGAVLERFLSCAGIQLKTPERLPVLTQIIDSIRQRVKTVSARALGSRMFVPAHMVTGAVNELATSTAYNIVRDRTEHPILQHILGAIMKEESKHLKFYMDMAQVFLQRLTKIELWITRIAVEMSLQPTGGGVGERVHSRDQVREMLRALFCDDASVLERTVDKPISELRGFEGFTRFSEVTKRQMGLTS